MGLCARRQGAEIWGLHLRSPGRAHQERCLCSGVGTRREGRSSVQKLLFYAGPEGDVSVALGASLPEAVPAPRDDALGQAGENLRLWPPGGAGSQCPLRAPPAAQEGPSRQIPDAHPGARPTTARVSRPQPRASHSPAAPADQGPAPPRSARPLPRVRFREAGGPGPGAGQLFLYPLPTNLLPSSAFWKGGTGSPGNFSLRQTSGDNRSPGGEGRSPGVQVSPLRCAFVPAEPSIDPLSL